MNQYLELGVVNNTHGIKGEVKFTLWCDSIDYIKQLNKVYLDDEGLNSLTLSTARQQKNMAILKFDEISNIEQAQTIKNKILYCNRDDVKLEEGVHYLADVIGCDVIDNQTNENYGTIVDIQNHGSCDIYDVVNSSKHYLIPVIDDIVKDVNVEDRIVKITLMKGLFDED